MSTTHALRGSNHRHARNTGHDSSYRHGSLSRHDQFANWRAYDVVRQRWQLFSHLPRTVTVVLIMCIINHMWTATMETSPNMTFSSLDWIVLAVAELFLLWVVLHRPAMFTLRNFRLSGIAIATYGLLLLYPLPGVIIRYPYQVPGQTIFAMAAAVGAMGIVFFLASNNYQPNRQRHLAQTRPVRPPVSIMRRNALSSTYLPPLAPSFSTSHESIFPIVIVISSVLILPIWIAMIGTPPLFSLLTGGSTLELVTGRQEALSDLSNPVLKTAIGVIRNIWGMFAAGWFTADFLLTPRGQWQYRSRARIFLSGAIGISAVLALITTERAIIGEMIAVCAIAGLLAKRKELEAKSLALMMFAAGLFPIMVGLLGGVGNMVSVGQSLWRRIFFLPADVMVRYFMAVPEREPFLEGASIPKFSMIFGGESFNLPEFIYIQYYARIPGVVGNANGSFFGVGWANWGLIGVVALATLAAIAVSMLDRVLDFLPERSAAAMRGVAVIFTILSSSSDVFRSVLAFAPGMLDILIIVGIVSAVDKFRNEPRWHRIFPRAPRHSLASKGPPNE